MTGRLFCGTAVLLLCSYAPTFLTAAEPNSAAAKPGASAQNSSDPEAAWQDLQKSFRPVTPPAAWQQTAPSEETVAKFKASESERLVKGAAQAKEYQTRFASSPRASEAAHKEYELLQEAAQLGNTDVQVRLDALDLAKATDAKAPESERVAGRLSMINRAFLSKLDSDRTAAVAEVEKGARLLLKEFPTRQEPYEMLMFVASEANAEKARLLAKEVVKGATSPELKEGAGALLTKLEAVGKPVAIKFRAVDGREVDIVKLRGKVVLLDFWATWCGPCVGEIPNVRATYEKLHPKGFEIVGISFDQDKDSLQRFVKEQKMTWPQYFDGKKWGNDYGKQFGIESIPTMWLIDKKGNLRDLNGRADLPVKVDKLLAETP